MMPHVIIKLWPGKSEIEKQRLADAITETLVQTLHYGADAISVAMEEVESSDWAKKVFQPDIVLKEATLYKKPGYKM